MTPFFLQGSLKTYNIFCHDRFLAKSRAGDFDQRIARQSYGQKGVPSRFVVLWVDLIYHSWHFKDEASNGMGRDYGKLNNGGVGLGIDRLVVLFTNAESIRDLLFFPFIRHED